MANYEWQDELFQKWKDNNWIALVKAPTGAGKTHAGVEALSRYLLEVNPSAKALIVSPSASVNKAWETELKSKGVKGVMVMTYQKAVNDMRRKGLEFDVLIADECHRLATPVQGQVLSQSPKVVLGLSATPEGAVEILGNPIIDVPIEDANLCDFTIHYVPIKMSAKEAEAYEAISKRMSERALKVTNGRRTYLKPNEDSVGWGSYDALVRQRRNLCYNMESRTLAAARLVDKFSYTEKTERIVVYSERTDQVREISRMLDSMAVSHAVCIQGMDTLSDFENSTPEHDCDTALFCGKNREGWNDTSITKVILASISNGVIRNVQTIGRALRKDPDNPDKHADIYVLMMDGTTDTKVKSKLDYPKSKVVTEDLMDILRCKSGV